MKISPWLTKSRDEETLFNNQQSSTEDGENYNCAYCRKQINADAESLLCASCKKLMNARVALEKIETKCESINGRTLPTQVYNSKKDGAFSLEEDSISLKKGGSLQSPSAKKSDDPSLKEDSISLKKDGSLHSPSAKKSDDPSLKEDGISLKKDGSLHSPTAMKSDDSSLQEHRISLKKDGSLHSPSAKKSDDPSSKSSRLSPMKNGKERKGYSLKQDGSLCCDTCQHILKQHRSMIKHVQSCGRKTEQEMRKICVYCQKYFNIRITLYKHEKVCKLKPPQTCKEDCKSKLEQPDRKHTKKSKKSKKSLQTFSDFEMNGNGKNHLQDFTCKICSRAFKKKRSIMKHIAICGVKEFYCDICGEVFTKIGKLKKHEAIHIFSPDNPHEPCFSEMRNTKVFSCIYCAQTFSAQITMFKHERRCKMNGSRHTGKKSVVVYLGDIDLNGSNKHIWGQFIWERSN